MANKKVSQLTSKPSVLSTDIVPIADPSTGQLFKTTLSALGAVIGSAVASVNGLVGVVVLDTDDIQELASPTNRWFTDTRARAALSGGTGISYNSGTGVITSSVTLAGLGGVPTSRTLTINGTAFDLSADRSWSIDSMVYPGAGIPISTGSAWGTSITNNSGNWNTAFSWGNHAGLYLPIGGGTITNSSNSTFVLNVLNNGTTDANGLYVNIGSSSTGVPFRVDKGGSPLFNIANSGESTFASNVTANSFVKSGGTSSQFLKADGSVDLRSFATTANLDNYLPLTGGSLTNSLSSGYVLSITNTTAAAGANGLYVDIASGSTGTPFRVDRAGVSLITVNYLGATLFKSTVTANQFIKANGTSSEYLMADGSVSTGPSFTYPSAGIVVSTGSAWGTSITNNSNNWNTAFSWGNHAGLYLSLSGGTLTGALSGTSATFSGQVNAASKHTWGSATNGTTGQIATDGTNNYFDYIGSLIFRGAAASNTLVTFTSSGAATFSSSITASGTISTTAGYGILSGGGAYTIGPSSTRGIIALNGSGDQILTFSTQSYIYNSSSLFRLLSTSDIDFVSGGSQRLLISSSTGAATFSSSVTATGFFESSDKNLKTLLEDNYQAKGIESISAKLYTKNGVTELGYYAQDVQPILPSAVTTGENGYLNLSYREVHTAKIASLEKRVEELEAQLNLA